MYVCMNMYDTSMVHWVYKLANWCRTDYYTVTFNFEMRFRLFIFFEGEKVAFNQSKGKVAGNIGKINACSLVHHFVLSILTSTKSGIINPFFDFLSRQLSEKQKPKLGWSDTQISSWPRSLGAVLLFIHGHILLKNRLLESIRSQIYLLLEYIILLITAHR